MFKFARQQSEEGEIGVVAHFVGIMIRNGSASSHISHAGPHEAFGYSEFVSLNTHSLFFHVRFNVQASNGFLLSISNDLSGTRIQR